VENIMNKTFNLLTLSLFLITTTMSVSSLAKDANYTSDYTPLEKCRVIESSAPSEEGVDSFSQECPGKDGYRIFHEGGDTRSWIVIKKGNKVVADLQQAVMQNEPGYFPYVSGKKMEWRYLGKTPIAIIFRIAGTNETGTQTKTKLLVVRLTGENACLIGTTTSNKKARKIADGKKTCKSFADYSSVYTPLEKCRVIESSDNNPVAQIDYFTEECPGKDHYRVFHQGGDLRSWIVVKKDDEIVIDLYNEVMQNAPGSFAGVFGKKMEWRYLGKTPIAIIFRIAGSDYTDTGIKNKSKLLVVRLAGENACVIGTTTSNEEARKIADSKKTCQ
jgi:hypothetical protein